MTEVLILCISLVVIVITSGIHFEVLRVASTVTPKLRVPPRQRTLVTVAAAFVGHFLEIWIYAFAYWLTASQFGLGRLTGTVEGGFFDYLYFSSASFTTLGLGDVVMEGPLRLMTGAEALNGLVLITWSASFTYLSMEKFWR
jgi:Ion channel